MYKSIVLEHERTNSTLELLDMATLKKQLRECDFITGTGTKRFGSKDYSKLMHAQIFKKNNDIISQSTLELNFNKD
ncbi:MAG: hypothetical protein ACRCSK_04515 [Fusobacteriaceae bacterium]